LKLFPFAQVMADDSLEIGQARPCELGLLVGCGAGALLLGDVQAEGGKRMSSLAYARGMRGVVKFH
jgi:methionyl-tRNA formyltransferase